MKTYIAPITEVIATTTEYILSGSVADAHQQVDKDLTGVNASSGEAKSNYTWDDEDGVSSFQSWED